MRAGTTLHRISLPPCTNTHTPSPPVPSFSAQVNTLAALDEAAAWRGGGLGAATGDPSVGAALGGGASFTPIDIPVGVDAADADPDAAAGRPGAEAQLSQIPEGTRLEYWWNEEWGWTGATVVGPLRPKDGKMVRVRALVGTAMHPPPRRGVPCLCFQSPPLPTLACSSPASSTSPPLRLTLAVLVTVLSLPRAAGPHARVRRARASDVRIPSACFAFTRRPNRVSRLDTTGARAALRLGRVDRGLLPLF
jgi:hypothetical protein